MDNVLKYIKQLDADKDLVDAYRELRIWFQNAGWSEEDLKNPPYYNNEVMSLVGRVQTKRAKFIGEIMAFFGDTISQKELDAYILNRLNMVNDETPLSDSDFSRKKNSLWQ
jgi:hypothetical protein